mgnify:CR=1 FL=1
MMLTSPRHEWKPRKPSGLAGSLRLRQKFATAIALNAEKSSPKDGKPTDSTTALTALRQLSAGCGGANHDKVKATR